MEPVSIKERIVTYIITFVMSTLLVGAASYFLYGRMKNEQKERRKTISKTGLHLQYVRAFLD